MSCQNIQIIIVIIEILEINSKLSKGESDVNESDISRFSEIFLFTRINLSIFFHIYAVLK